MVLFVRDLEFFRVLTLLVNPEYHLTVKRSRPPQIQQYLKVIFPELLSEERLKIDTNYLEMDALVEFLKAFRIGFCFYDTRFDFFDRFNYYKVLRARCLPILRAVCL